MWKLKRSHVEQTDEEGGQRTAVLQALLVTFLWSTSWVLIKIGLQEIPALTFAGLRYTLAFFCLLPLGLRSGHFASLAGIGWSGWTRLVVLGVLFYTITQGAQFLGLAYLPAVTVSLLLNLTTLIVAFLGIVFLQERPSRLQWAGVILFLLGVMLYFYPLTMPEGEVTGLLIVLLGVFANGLSSILGRSINRMRSLHPLAVTSVSMGVGSVLLLLSGMLTQGFPDLDLSSWLIILWLAVINTAFAFTLWNQTLRTLTAVESNILNNTMLIQIAVLAWLFLGERLTASEIAGMLLVALGAVIVQIRRRGR